MPKRRFIVTGHMRSGTSCLAGILDHLGVPMQGPGLCHADHNNPTGYFEDLEFSLLLCCKQDDGLEKYVADRRHLDVWGIKEPRLGLTPERLTRHFERDEVPTMVISCRDPRDIFESLGRAGAPMAYDRIAPMQDKLLDACRRFMPLVIDFDAMRTDPEVIVHAMVDDLRLPSSRWQIERAIASVFRR